MICLNQTAYSGKESPPASNGMVWRVNASTGEWPRFAFFKPTFLHESLVNRFKKGQPPGCTLL